ncbi:nuclear pore complex protein Nup98-Nup96-like [Toxorhynchites rutilus septentrionalis]|uniref:nuclear pore complex protein Nup98-Nup96-like n=1 Tax=Toxorhynchites rutilus septentrionalis TaxID=329112 RepID=UPI002478A40F|nr:nuclear pore complex protein Nup98-Nup96-like [Toxorhynchites rutilus septentrionalis]
MEYIAMDCVIIDNFPYSKSVLIEIKDVKQISNWFIKDKILSDFFELNVKFDLTRNTIDDEVSATRLEELKPKLSDLCSAIKMFPCPTQKVSVQIERNHPVVGISDSSFIAQDPLINSCALKRNAFEKLSLLQEYVHQELRHMYAERVSGRRDSEIVFERKLLCNFNRKNNYCNGGIK